MPLTSAISLAAPLGNEPTVDREGLDTVVAGVGNIDVPVPIDGHTKGGAELARAGAL